MCWHPGPLHDSSGAEDCGMSSLPGCDLGCKVTLFLSFVYFNFPLWVHHSMTSCLPNEFCYICKSCNSNFPFCIENGPPDCFFFMILGEIYWRQERDAPSITCQLMCDSMSLNQLTRLEIFKQWIFKHKIFYMNCTNTTELLLQISITSIVVFPNFHDVHILQHKISQDAPSFSLLILKLNFIKQSLSKYRGVTGFRGRQKINF